MNYQPNYKYVPPADYHALTKFYDFLCSVLGLGRSFKRRILRTVGIREGEKLLDVGCGTGVFLEIAKSQYPKVEAIGIDPDEQALRIAKKRLQKQNLSAELIRGYAESLPMAENTFDFIFSTLVFHHIPDEIKKKALEEIYRVLKPAGKFILTDFGKSESRLLRLILSFGKDLYLEGNLRGLIPQFMLAVGFKNLQVPWRTFLKIETIIAEK